MEWQRPEALYLILPLCAGWFVLSLESNRRRRLARHAFAAAAMWPRILPPESSLRFWTKLLLREFAIAIGLVALAGPRFGTEYEQIVPRGADLYVLIDVSRSMLAGDVPPTRLGRAKADVSSLLNRLQGERVGLIAFAGQAVVKCPLTVDYDSFRRSLEELDPDSAPRGGTAIGDAIRKGLEVFHANADRDQAMILITDGDDQQSYPLEAAAVASERHVTIFTIGLGDAVQGARIPQKGDTQSFIEYQGEQVWSKLDSHLLEQIAVKTSGVYVPAGTRAYDLGELYSNHLQGRHGRDSASRQKIRRSERFQTFLAMSLAALLLDLCIAPYRQTTALDEKRTGSPEKVHNKRFPPPPPVAATAVITVGVLSLSGLTSAAFAIEPATSVREGLRLYSKEQYEEARAQFANAGEELDKHKSAAAAIAAFDEACAAHRNGDLDQARDSYLRAGLSTDRSIAVAAHFNLGMLSAEKARSLCGENPELVPADKRAEILEQLSLAIAAYRHCLELKSDHGPSRRNIELVRKWVKYYTDRWREMDRQKRRDESNLLKFLEFLIQSQKALKETVGHLKSPIHSDTVAELKRAQEELKDEIPTLREKIESELRPSPDPQMTTGSQTGTVNPASNELDEGIKLLQGWADKAGEKMSAAARRLAAKDPAKTMTDQQSAIDELETIWETVIPFRTLLVKDLADQTSIVKSVVPEGSARPDEGNLPSSSKSHEEPDSIGMPDDNQHPKGPQQGSQQLQIADDDWHSLEESQSRTLKRTRLLAPKAEAELNQLEHAPTTTNPTNDQKATDDLSENPHAVDPERVKEGYRKAIELAPQAVEKMEAAIDSLKQKDRQSAAERAVEARQILEEILKSQPKDEQQQEQRNQDQDKQDDQKQNENQPKNDPNDEEKKNEEKDSGHENDKQNSKPDEKSKKQEQQQQVSPDRLEDALRKVRERQQEKRERDRKVKGLFLGRSPVDKDW